MTRKAASSRDAAARPSPVRTGAAHEGFPDPAPGEACREIFGLLADAGSGRQAFDWTTDGGLVRALSATGTRVVSARRAGDPAMGPRPSGTEYVRFDDEAAVPFTDASFDLVALEADPLAAGESIPAHRVESRLDEACRILRPGGQLLIPSRSRVRNRVWGWRAPGLRRLARMLARRGFGSLRDFGVQPRVGAPLLAADLASTEGVGALYSRSGSGGLVSQLLFWLGASPLGGSLIARRFFVASREPMRSVLERDLAADRGFDSTLHWVGWSNPAQAIARVDIGDRECVVRLALDAAGAGRITRNAAAIERVRAGLDEDRRRLVPELASRTSLAGRDATLESFLPGRPVDTLGGRAGVRATANARSDFLAALAEIDPLAPERNAHWLEQWVGDVRVALGGALEPARLDAVCDFLVSSPDARRMRVGTVHGDFSPRNLLVDERTGQLSGVIDWDLSRPAAPTFVDPLHWEIRCEAWRFERYFDVLLKRMERLAAVHSSRRTAPTPAAPADPADWWRDSLWAHLVYGAWYNLNLATLHGDSRVHVAARLAEFVPGGQGVRSSR